MLSETGPSASSNVDDPALQVFKDLLNRSMNMCSLFNKICDELEGECPFDVSDQALSLYVMASRVIRKEKTAKSEADSKASTFKAEVQKLMGLVDKLLALEKVKRLSEAKEMDKLKTSLDSAVKNKSLEVACFPMAWAVNVLYLSGIDYTALDNDRYIIDCPLGDLVGLNRRTEQLWECLCDDLNIIDSDPSSFDNSLQQLGFQTTALAEISPSIPKLMIERQTPLYWSVRFLKYKLFNDPMLAHVTRYPYHQEKINSWFDEELEDPKSPSKNVKVKMINVFNETGQALVDGFLKDLTKTQGTEIFFHGTSHSDAMFILTRGVELSMGAHGQDFSSGDGFYLSESLQDAKQWAGAGRGKYQAVIVYKLSLAGQAGGLKLVGGSDQWQKIVSICRDSYKNLSQKFEVLKDVKYIRGPASRNPIYAVHKKTKFEYDKINQLCIRDQSFANSQCSMKNTSSVIFY